jgi:hypothetical protein
VARNRRGTDSSCAIAKLGLRCPMLALLFTWLRHRIRMVEQEDRDLLIGLLADIHSPMNSGTLPNIATVKVFFYTKANVRL